MNKRAESIIMMIFEILVVLLVVGMFFSIADNYAKSESINKIIYTKELQMMTHTLLATPGDALVEFPYNSSAYVFIFNEDEVIGYLAGERLNEFKKEHQKIYLPEGYSVWGISEEKEKFCLRKFGHEISLGSCS